MDDAYESRIHDVHDWDCVDDMARGDQFPGLAIVAPESFGRNRMGQLVQVAVPGPRGAPIVGGILKERGWRLRRTGMNVRQA